MQCSGWKVSKIASAAAAAACFHSVNCARDVEISDDEEGGRIGAELLGRGRGRGCEPSLFQKERMTTSRTN